MRLASWSLHLRSIKRLLSCCLVVAAAASFALARAGEAGAPVLITERDSMRAVALESVTLLREPFSAESPVAFGADRRTRVMLFALNVPVYAGEGANAFTAEAEDAGGRLHPLRVEYVGPLRGFEGITQIVVRLGDQLNDAGDVLVRVSLRGMSSNRVRIAIGHVGGGPPDDEGAVPTPAPPVPPAPSPLLTPDPYTGPATAADTVRFLEQSTFGPTQGEVARVRALGFRAFLEEQFNEPASSYPALPLMHLDSNQGCPMRDYECYRDNYLMYPLQTRFFKNALYGRDQLRQRVAFALHQILTVSGRDMNQPSWMAPYLQTLDRNAFGSFRQLLQEVTLNAAMGEYLNTAGNSKEKPNENFARELLQLFTVGPDLLNADGTPKLDARGARIPTYNQEAITNFARVFTGWNFAPPPAQGVLNFIDPMVANERNHDTGPKTLLGGAGLPPNQTALQDLNAALDNVFNHPNTPPFISQRLIRHLVTSNPSPAYVERVARVFEDNCAGFYPEANCTNARGDLKATVRAILLDPEARGDVKTDPDYGRLREPALFIASYCRAFDARGIGPNITPVPSDGNLNPVAVAMGQDVLRPPTVFGYFPADYTVPGRGLKGPEFGIMSSSTALTRIGFAARMVFHNGVQQRQDPDTPYGTYIFHNSWHPLAADPPRLADALDALLLHGTMSPVIRDGIVQAAMAVPTSNPNHLRDRTQTAIYLVISSQQYQVQR